MHHSPKISKSLYPGLCLGCDPLVICPRHTQPRPYVILRLRETHPSFELLLLLAELLLLAVCACVCVMRCDSWMCCCVLLHAPPPLSQRQLTHAGPRPSHSAPRPQCELEAPVQSELPLKMPELLDSQSSTSSSFFLPSSSMPSSCFLSSSFVSSSAAALLRLTRTAMP